MNYRMLRQILGLVFVGMTAVHAAPRPNFVFFITDDQPYLGLSATGNTVLKTPAMDAVAAKGVLFENAFATTAICCCSRASILTGQYMRRHGIEDFAKPLSAAQLQEIFPVLLRKAGYRTAFLGKYAVGSPKEDPRLSLPAQLFDLWYGFPQGIAYKQKEDGKDRYLTTVMEEKAMDFLRASKPDQPFCLIMALKEPHGPTDYFDPEFTAPKSDAPIPRPATMTRKAFDALPEVARASLAASPRWIDDTASFEASVRKQNSYISRADLAVGRVTAALAAAGLDQNTVVIFMSDHGSFGGAHALTGKWLMYEESIRLPLIISDPRLPAATRGRRTPMALNIDLAPTILAMAGVPIPAGMQGSDLQPVLRDPKAKVHDDWYYEHVYTDPGRRPIPRTEGVRTERWKYIRYTEANPPVEELFDLAGDPREETNLAPNPAHRDTLTKLRARCDELRLALK